MSATPAPSAERRWPVVAGVFALSLFVRAVVLRGLLADDPLFRVPILDDRAYLEMARRMADGHADAWFLAPLHPWLVAAASKVFALGMPLACGVNAVLGAAASGAAALAGCELHSRRAGIVAGALHALAGAFVFVDVTPGQEPALALLHVAAFVAAIRLAREPRLGAAAALGVLTGIAMMGRATSVALLLLAVPAFAQRHAGRRLRVAAACAAGLLAVLVPAAVRNAGIAGAVTPFPWGGGPNLYAGNGPDSRASRSLWASELSGDPAEMAQRAREIADAAAARVLTHAEVSSWWTRRAWAERGTAGEALGHLARKAALFWSAEEEGGNHSVASEREFSPYLALVPMGAWWLLAGGVAAWWLLRARTPAADGAALCVAGTWVLLTVIFPVSRYRIPCAALAAVLVGAAVVEVARRAVPRARLVQAAALGVVVSVVAFLPLRDITTGTAHANVAWAHLQAGDPPAVAKARLLRAVAEDPDCGPARTFLASLLADEGDVPGALRELDLARRDPRTAWSARVASLPLLVAARRLREAHDEAEALLAEGRADPELFANAALVALASRDQSHAMALLGKAERIDPSHPAVLRARAALDARRPR